MKIKTDFVTNSSSASYIIAVKSNLSREDIKNELLKNKKALKGYFVEYKPYWSDFSNGDYEDIDEITELETEEQQINMLAKKLAQNIYNETNSKHVMKIYDFNICAREGGNEDIDLFSNWLYDFGSIDEENLKIKRFD